MQAGIGHESTKSYRSGRSGQSNAHEIVGNWLEGATGDPNTDQPDDPALGGPLIHPSDIQTSRSDDVPSGTNGSRETSIGLTEFEDQSIAGPSRPRPIHAHTAPNSTYKGPFPGTEASRWVLPSRSSTPLRRKVQHTFSGTDGTIIDIDGFIRTPQLSPCSSMSFRSASHSEKLKGDSTHRRNNPKASRARRSKLIRDDFGNVVQTLQPAHTPELSVGQEGCTFLSDGTHLARVSDAVPYLLGPPKYVDALEQIREARLEDEVLLEALKRPFIQNSRVSLQDKALFWVLTIMRLPVENLDDATADILSFFLIREGKLQLWRANGANEPNEIDIDFNQFADRVCDWQRSTMMQKNGILVRWTEILNALKTRNMDISCVPAHALYKLSQLVPDHPQETAKYLDELKTQFESGFSLQSQVRLSTISAPGGSNNSDAVAFTRPRDPKALHAKRFSHSHPLGQLAVIEEGPDRQESYYDTQMQTYNKPSIRKVYHDKKHMYQEKKERFWRSRFGRTVKWTAGGLFGVGIIVAILMVAHFKIGQRKKDMSGF